MFKISSATRVFLILFALSVIAGGTSDAEAIQDSSGLKAPTVRHSQIVTTWDSVREKPETATRWPRWSEITDKPDMAIRWPSWNEVSGKPSTFKPAAHHHDSRYIRRDASGSITGNLSVSGTVRGNRLVTGDVGGDRWCRANSAGRIQCTHKVPTSEIFDASRFQIVHEETCLNNHDVNYVRAKCPSGTRVIGCSGGPGDVREDGEGHFIRILPNENSCELMIGKPVCTSSRAHTYQNVFATCIR